MRGIYIWGLLRIAMGWLLLWAFLDKVFGLGFDTAPDKSWLRGVSPTAGFLKFAVKGPFASVFHSLAGNTLVDWLFMGGLLLIGLAMILGIGVKLAGYGGAILMFLMYAAGSIWPNHNPILDEHIIYALVFLGLARMNAGEYLGFGKRWGSLSFVRKFSVFK